MLKPPKKKTMIKMFKILILLFISTLTVLPNSVDNINIISKIAATNLENENSEIMKEYQRGLLRKKYVDALSVPFDDRSYIGWLRDKAMRPNATVKDYEDYLKARQKAAALIGELSTSGE